MPKRKKVQSSHQANSLLPPQHHHRRHHHLEDAILNCPPLGDLSSPEEVGKLRSPKKRSGCQISGPPYKGMIPKPNSPPSSSSGRHTTALTSSSWHVSRRRPRTASGPPPPKTASGCPDPCRARLWPCICHTILHRLIPATVPTPLSA